MSDNFMEALAGSDHEFRGDADQPAGRFAFSGWDSEKDTILYAEGGVVHVDKLERPPNVNQLSIVRVLKGKGIALGRELEAFIPDLCEADRSRAERWHFAAVERGSRKVQSVDPTWEEAMRHVVEAATKAEPNPKKRAHHFYILPFDSKAEPVAVGWTHLDSKFAPPPVAVRDAAQP